MIFRQLFQPVSSTFTYLLADPLTREALLIDAVIEEAETYLGLVDELQLRLKFTLETHLHADHVTAGALLRERVGSRIVIHADAGARCADRLVRHGELVQVGAIALEVRETPGHTDGCVSFVGGDRVFTGDALLIGGCGRTDFQSGSSDRLYDSVQTQLFTLPADTLVYPAHDYRGRTVSTVKEERSTNPRLGQGKTRRQFAEIMSDLRLPPPKQLARAVPANRRCGRPTEPGG